MVIAGFPLPSAMQGATPEEAQSFTKELQAQLDAPAISDFENYLFDDQYFSDRSAHLTTEDAEIRTKQLAEKLKSYLDGQ